MHMALKVFQRTKKVKNIKVLKRSQLLQLITDYKEVK